MYGVINIFIFPGNRHGHFDIQKTLQILNILDISRNIAYMMKKGEWKHESFYFFLTALFKNRICDRIQLLALSTVAAALPGSDPNAEA